MNCSTISLQTFPLADWTLAHEASLAVIHIWDHIVLLFSRRCEYFDCPNPSGLTIKQDGRMYICDHCDTLTVREIDDSLSKLFLHPVPNKEFIDGVFNAPVCSNCWIVVHDQSYNVTKFSKDGEFVWQMKPSTSIRCFCFDSSDLLYCKWPGQSLACTFSHDMVSVFSRDLILEGKSGGIACFGGESNGLT